MPSCQSDSQSVSRLMIVIIVPNYSPTLTDILSILCIRSLAGRHQSCREKGQDTRGAVPPGPADASKSRSTELSTTRYIGRPSVRLSDCGSIHTFADVSVHELRIKRRRFITWSQTFLLSELGRATLEADYFRAAKASLCGGTLALASFSRRLSTKTSYVNAQPLSNAV